MKSLFTFCTFALVLGLVTSPVAANFVDGPINPRIISNYSKGGVIVWEGANSAGTGFTIMERCNENISGQGWGVNLNFGIFNRYDEKSGLEPKDWGGPENCNYFVEAGTGNSEVRVSVDEVRNLRSTAEFANRIDIQWNASHNGEEAATYRIDWSIDGVNWSSEFVETNSTSLTNLSSGKAYKIRVSDCLVKVCGASTDEIVVFTEGLSSNILNVIDSQGNPVFGGSIKWNNNYKGLGSSGATGLTANGQVEWLRSTPGPVWISGSNLQLGDGISYSKLESIAVLGLKNSTLQLPPVPELRTIKVSVRLPNGLPVVGANVELLGLEREKSGFAISPALFPFEGVTDANGVFQTTGFANPDNRAVVVYVTYDDGVLLQRKDFVIWNDEAEAQLDEMPWISVGNVPKVSNYNQLVSIPVQVLETSVQRQTPNTFSLARRTKVKIVPPKGASQKCRGSKLSSTVGSSGKAELKVCATKSGTYKIQGAGAAATSTLQLLVKGAPPLNVSAASAKSFRAGEIKVAWNPPAFTGGKPIIEYTVTASRGSKVIKRVLRSPSDLRKRSVTLSELPSGSTWRISILARTSNGMSDPVIVSGYIA